MYFLFLYLANNIRDDQDLKFIIHAFIALLIFEGALSYLQHRYDEPFFPSSLGGPKGIDGRVSGTWSDFNDAAWYLTFVIPLPLSMLMVLESYRQKFVYGLALVLGSAALVWSGSRAGWISFGVAAGVVGALVFSNIRRRETISKTVMVAMLVFVLACPLFPRLYTKIYERFIGEDQGSADPVSRSLKSLSTLSMTTRSWASGSTITPRSCGSTTTPRRGSTPSLISRFITFSFI